MKLVLLVGVIGTAGAFLLGPLVIERFYNATLSRQTMAMLALGSACYMIALAIALPLLILWTDAVSLLGGMVAAKLQLDLSISYFFNALPAAVKIENLWLGLSKGVVFGALIALVSCHFGLRIEPNTESLGRGTTSAVVSSITVVILADAVFAIAFSNVGI